MEKADLEYCFVYRPDSLIVNELFADFRKDGSIRMLPVYKHWKPWLENIRCAYTTGWKHYRFFSWMNTGCARDYSLADILSAPPPSRWPEALHHLLQFITDLPFQGSARAAFEAR